MSKPTTQPAAVVYVAMRGVTARYDNITPRTARRWIERGILPKPDLTVNGRQYWKPETLDANDRKRVIDAADKRPLGQFDGARNRKHSVAAE
jgi:hypothetical protein